MMRRLATCGALLLGSPVIVLVFAIGGAGAAVVAVVQGVRDAWRQS